MVQGVTSVEDFNFRLLSMLQFTLSICIGRYAHTCRMSVEMFKVSDLELPQEFGPTLGFSANDCKELAWLLNSWLLCILHFTFSICSSEVCECNQGKRWGREAC